MTLEEFIKDILGDDAQKLTQEEIEGLYIVSFPFANLAMKKWQDEKVKTSS